MEAHVPKIGIRGIEPAPSTGTAHSATRLHSRFRSASSLSIAPRDHLHEFLNRQREGLTSHYLEMGYPFTTPMREQRIEDVPFREKVHRGNDTPRRSTINRPLSTKRSFWFRTPRSLCDLNTPLCCMNEYRCRSWQPTFRTRFPITGPSRRKARYFAPEYQSPLQFLRRPMVRCNADRYDDLARCFKESEGRLAYLLFQFWAEEEGEAMLALGAASCAQCFMDDRPIFELECLHEAEMMAPQRFQARVKARYNLLQAKMAAAPRCDHYREAWGVKLGIFVENSCS